MLLSIVLLVLLIALIFYQAMQGLFSALIMVVLTLCALSFGFGTYEWVAVNWMSKWKPEFAYPLALALTVAVPLLVLRVILDKAIHRAPLLPQVIDRAGGAVCGFVTAMCLVGVSALSLQMMPMETIFGYVRVDRPSKEKPDGATRDPEPPEWPAEEHNIFLSPDKFAVATAGMMSGGIFSGEKDMAENTPDLVRTVGWVGSVPADVSRYAPPGSVSIIRTDTVDYVYSWQRKSGRGRDAQGEFKQIEPSSGHYFRVVRIKLSDDARDDLKRHTFTPRQIRLVGSESGSTQLESVAPIAVQSKAPDFPNRHISKRMTRWGFWPITDDAFLPLQAHNDEIEVVYELPTNFKPRYLAYKLGARAPVSFKGTEPGSDQTASAAPSPPSQPASATNPTDTVPTTGRTGRVRTATALAGRSFFGGRLPLKLKNYESLRRVDVRRGALNEGHLLAYVNEQEEGNDRELSKLEVPSDKRLLQLNVGALQAKSLLGRALSTAVRTIQNFTVEDEQGHVYKICGKYAIAEDNAGHLAIELQYFPEAVGSIGGVAKFTKLNEANLSGDYQLVLLFLVDPGARIKYFSTGGSATRRDDLSRENLVAPN